MPAIVICLIFFTALMLSASHITHAEPAKNAATLPQHLYQLSKFINWPNYPNNSPIELCLFPSTPQQEDWQKINLKRSQGREIRIKHIEGENDLPTCTILFSHAGIPNSFIQKNYYTLVSNSVLSVGERKNFANDGGIIELAITSENIPNLKINLKTVTEAGLSIDANLIEIASAVFEQGHP